MAINWNDYELVLVEDSWKECEVTGRDMGGIDRYACPVSDLIGDASPKWTPVGHSGSYGGYQAYSFYFVKTDDEALYLYTDRGYRQDIVLKPGEEWTSGWYSFGEWSYCVDLQLRKKE